MSTKRRPDQLTKTEKVILLLLWEGHTAAEVAQRLMCSRRTVDFHIANIFAKWKVDCRMKMIRIALAKGIITPPAREITPRYDTANQRTPIE